MINETFSVELYTFLLPLSSAVINSAESYFVRSHSPSTSKQNRPVSENVQREERAVEWEKIMNHVGTSDQRVCRVVKSNDVLKIEKRNERETQGRAKEEKWHEININYTNSGNSIRPLSRLRLITTSNPPISRVPFIITSNIAPNIIIDCTTSV